MARLRIIAWLREVLRRLEQAGIKVYLAKFYVDDIRLVLNLISWGYGRTRRWGSWPTGVNGSWRTRSWTWMRERGWKEPWWSS